MKKLSLGSALLAALSFSLTNAAIAEPTQDQLQQLQLQGKGVIKSLAMTLKGELEGAMKEGGPEAAIKVCNTKAAPLTESVSQQQGWIIGRTSNKLRNQENAPDAWEQKVLNKFQKQADAGINLKTLAYSEVITNPQGQDVFRMMKAIPTGEKCLGCHGSKIKPELSSQLDSLYPEDQARGFNKGDLRGAFSLQKVL